MFNKLCDPRVILHTKRLDHDLPLLYRAQESGLDRGSAGSSQEPADLDDDGRRHSHRSAEGCKDVGALSMVRVSAVVAFLLADLGVTKSHSRPHVSNDNPFSESQFKTMKYRPDFPDRFGCIQDARAFGQPFFHWYNDEHRHSGLGLHTPASVHYGQAGAIREQRAIVLTTAYAAHPERFVRVIPEPPKLPTAVWINPPPMEGAKTQ